MANGERQMPNYQLLISERLFNNHHKGTKAQRFASRAQDFDLSFESLCLCGKILYLLNKL